VAFGSDVVVTIGADGSTETALPLPEVAPRSIPPIVPTTEFVTVVRSASV